MRKLFFAFILLGIITPSYSQGLVEMFYKALQSSSETGVNPFAKNKDCSVEEFKYLNGGFFKAQELGLDLKEGYRSTEVFNESSHNEFLGRRYVSSTQRVFFITRKDGSPVGYAYEYYWKSLNRRYYLGVPILLSDNYDSKREVMLLFDASFKQFITSNSSPITLEPLIIVLMNPFSKEIATPEVRF